MCAARGCDQLIGWITLDIEPCRQGRDFEIDGPDVQPAERANDLRVFEVELDTAELHELGELHNTIAEIPQLFSERRSTSSGRRSPLRAWIRM